TDGCRALFLALSFFFQAEDGIRDFHVTGVQTCALPIYVKGVGSSTVTVDVTQSSGSKTAARECRNCVGGARTTTEYVTIPTPGRSEERRVGKECRSRKWTYESKKKTTSVVTDDIWTACQ